MPIVINLVATRSKDGDHPALLRWYHDHVHLLLGFDGLHGATLYRRIAEPVAAGPEYLCLYQFPSHADFLAFEISPARARAQQVVQTGWAREGIEIVQRTQYLRLGQTTGRVAPVGSGETVHHIQSLALGAGEPPGVARWLADQVCQKLGAGGFCQAAWHRAWDATREGGDALVVAASRAGEAGSAEPVGFAQWAETPSDDAFGLCPASVAVRWQGAYQQLVSWAR